MKVFLFAVLIAFSIAKLNAISVSCYYGSSYYWHEVPDSNAPYSCILETLNIKSKTTITNVPGASSSVLALYIKGGTCEVFPDGFGKFFTNIKFLTVWKSGLKSLTSNDLIDFPEVIELWVYENPIEYFEADLFKNNKKLQHLDLHNNKISRIGYNFFDDLPNLGEVVLGGNKCFKDVAKSAEELNALMEKSYEICSGVEEYDQIPLTEDERKILDDYSKKFDIDFPTIEEQRKAVNRIKLHLQAIKRSQELFENNLIHYQLDLYRFAHMSDAEFEAKFLGLLPPGSISRRKRQAENELKCNDIPKEKDWRDENIVPEVKDQKNCGSCYIFSSTGAIESAVAIEYGIKPVNLSRQNSLNCLLDPDTKKANGCNPGRPEWVWSDAKSSKGLVIENKGNEYQGVLGTCDKDASKSSFSDVEIWKQVLVKGTEEEIEEQIKCRLATSGPFHIGMKVTKTGIGSFRSGVYDTSKGFCEKDEKVNHGMLLVGYGEQQFDGQDKPTKFWIIQNSWTADWGEKGFLRIKRGVNMCNFAKDAFYPVISKKFSPINKPNVCKESGEIVDANGKYVKSFCFIDEEKSKDEAQLFCLEQQMRLFKTNTIEDEANILKYANENWQDREEFQVLIEGKEPSSTVCKSIVREDSKDIVVNNETDCTDETQFICEFVDIEKN